MNDKKKLIITLSLITLIISLFIYNYYKRQMPRSYASQELSKFSDNTHIEEVDITLEIEIDDINKIMGKKVTLKDENNKEIKSLITSKEVHIKDIAKGIYQVTMPVASENIFAEERNINVTDEEKQFTFTYKENYASLAHDEVIALKNNGEVFSTISFNKQNIIISINEKYRDVCAFIKVYDMWDNLIREYNFMSQSIQTPVVDEVAYQTNYKIVIYHVDPENGIMIKSNHMDDKLPHLNVKKGMNTYFIGNFGLYQAKSADYEIYQDKIDSYANFLINSLSEDELFNKNKRPLEKSLLYSSIMQLDSIRQKEYLQKYDYIFKGSKPVLTNEALVISSVNDFYKAVKALDKEDGEYEVNSTNFSLSENLSSLSTGSYFLNYTLKDIDDNITSGTLALTIDNGSKEEATLALASLDNNSVNKLINYVFSNKINDKSMESLASKVKEEVKTINLKDTIVALLILFPIAISCTVILTRYDMKVKKESN